MEHIIRPKATVLPESAMLPEENLVQPAPTRFTHEVKADQPYYYAVPHSADSPDGTFPAGTQVVLMPHHEGPMCQVVDGQGLRVVTRLAGLRPLG